MTLIQLRYLVAVVENGFNISLAAEVLHTSQPGISRQIRLLEEHLGVLILHRKGGRITGLTEDGEQVFLSAKRIVSEAGVLGQRRDDFANHATGRLRVAANHTVALTMLPRPIAQLRAKLPGVKVDIRTEDANTAFSLLRGGDLDVGLATELPDSSYRLVAFLLNCSPRVVLVPTGHPLLDLEAIEVRDIAAYPLIVEDMLTSTNRAMVRSFRAHGVEPEPAIRTTDTTVTKSLVECGAGIAIVAAVAYDSERDQGVRAIDISHIVDPGQLWAVTDPFRHVPGYVFDLIELMSPKWTRQMVEREVRVAVNSSYP